MAGEPYDRELYKAVAAALVAGIILTAAFNLYMRGKIAGDEAFTELYFNDHRSLPSRMQAGGGYNVSFSFTNHEGVPKRYVWAVESHDMNLTDETVLYDGDTALLIIELSPSGPTWNVTFDSLTNSTTVTRGLGDSTLEPISLNAAGLGAVFNANLTRRDLERGPYRAYYEAESTGENSTHASHVNSTLTAEGDAIVGNSIVRRVDSALARKPFTVKVYESSDKSSEALEIHYWYEVR